MVKTKLGIIGGINMGGNLVMIGDMDRFERGDLGRCCGCKVAPATGAVLIPLVIPADLPDLRGTGWCCSKCNGDFNGAIAVLCDQCGVLYHVAGPQAVQEFVEGPLTSHNRMPITDLCDMKTGQPVSYEHDGLYHLNGTPPQLGMLDFFLSYN